MGEVVRLYLVNTANTRIFNFAVRGARMKLVGGDSGRYERETFVDEVMLAPSERAVIDVLFETAGDVRLEHRTPDKVYDLGGFAVAGAAAGDAAASYEKLRVDAELSAEHQAIERDVEREPDKVLAFFSRMPLLYGNAGTTASLYACPMHPEITASEPSTCPKCGMRLVAVESAAPTSYVCPMHPEVTASEPATCPKCGMKLVPADAPADAPAESHDGVGHGAHDHATITPRPRRRPRMGGPDAGDQPGDGREQHGLAAHRPRDRGGERRDLLGVHGRRPGQDPPRQRDGDSDHPMHHPFHVHGAGRFLILSRDGEPEPNLVWKDTVLLRSGQTVDILLDVSNPGLWMAHCHIAEHIQTGMMFSFNVARRDAEPDSSARAREAA